MPAFTQRQRQIISSLPATTDQLATCLYGRSTVYERRCVWAHISMLRRKLPKGAIVDAPTLDTGNGDKPLVEYRLTIPL